MPSLILTIFLIQLIIQIINAIGSTTLNELIWLLYIRLPTSTSRSAREANALRLRALQLKREMAAISPQDDFAKWAKLRRQHDKATADYEKASSQTQGAKSTLTSTVTATRFILFQGGQFLIQSYNTKSPMFWIPQGWLPFYVEWLLCFPRAPIGSVSIQVWGFACGCVLGLAREAIASTWTLAVGTVAEASARKGTSSSAGGTGKQKMQGMAFEASPNQSPRGEKKEL